MRGKKKKQREDGSASPASEATVSAAAALTPVDVQQKEFRLAFRGYNEQDVDSFLDVVTEALARMHEDNKRLREALDEGGGPAAAAGPLIEDAQRRAEEIVREARERAASLLAEVGPGGVAGGMGYAAAPMAGVSVEPFLAREREFLQGLAGLIQRHAEAVKEEVRRSREVQEQGMVGPAEKPAPAGWASATAATPEPPAPGWPADEPGDAAASSWAVPAGSTEEPRAAQTAVEGGSTWGTETSGSPAPSWETETAAWPAPPEEERWTPPEPSPPEAEMVSGEGHREMAAEDSWAAEGGGAAGEPAQAAESRPGPSAVEGIPDESTGVPRDEMAEAAQAESMSPPEAERAVPDAPTSMPEDGQERSAALAESGARGSEEARLFETGAPESRSERQSRAEVAKDGPAEPEGELEGGDDSLRELFWGEE